MLNAFLHSVFIGTFYLGLFCSLFLFCCVLSHVEALNWTAPDHFNLTQLDFPTVGEILFVGCTFIQIKLFVSCTATFFLSLPILITLSSHSFFQFLSSSHSSSCPLSVVSWNRWMIPEIFYYLVTLVLISFFSCHSLSSKSTVLKMLWVVRLSWHGGSWHLRLKTCLDKTSIDHSEPRENYLICSLATLNCSQQAWNGFCK